MNLKDIKSPIWLDIETGGVKSSESSILSIASGQGRDIRSVFAPPVAGTFLSSFSEQQIIPQLRGKSLLSEKQSIESLIQQLKENPRAPLAGFNIRGFDIGFIQRRARNYGLEKEFISTMKGRSIIDPAYHVKDIISSAIVSHTDRGTFKELLSGKTWSEAEDLFKNLPFEQRPTEYNLLAQVRGYQEASSQTAKFKGWKLEDVYKLLPEEGKLVGQAHEASTDIMMTQRVARAVQSGELERELLKPEKALQWMETVKARGYHQFGPGRLLAQADIDKMGFGLPRWWQTKTARRAGIAALSIAGIAALSRFSGRDDSYNGIEGLPHGGFAQQGRLQLTEFGSGWKGQHQLANRLAKYMFGTSGASRGLAFEGVQFNRAGAENIFRSFRESIENKYVGAGIIGRISKKLDIRALSKAESFMRNRELGVLVAPKSYLKEAGRVQGISAKNLEAGIRSHEGLHLGIAELGLREQVEDMAEIVPLDFARKMQDIPAYRKNPMAVTEEYLAYSQTMKHTGRAPLGVDYTVASKTVEELVQQQPRLREYIIPSRNSANNSMDGMGHSGLAHRLRKLLTPFGSKWDGLRNLVRGTETFEQMLASTGFQKALQSAVEVKQLGKGAMGTASLMKATFRDREFQFVRKTGVLGVDEVSSMKALQNKFAPTVYSSSEKHIDMELFQGKTASELIREGKLTSKNVQDIEKTARQMHRADISHGDFHAKNIMITPEGNVGPIDFGAAGPIGSSGLTPLANDQGQIIQGYYGGYTRVARKQHGKWVPEAIEIRDAEYDWGRIEQMKERIAKMKLQQARQLPATSIMPASISTETATINENTFYAATKKVRHADLQKSATKTAWEAGKNGSRRSKL